MQNAMRRHAGFTGTPRITPTGGDDGRRVLLIDGDGSLHQDFQRALADDPPGADGLHLDGARQGMEGLHFAVEALRQGRPYALAFVGLRSPTWREELETIQRLRHLDNELQIAVCVPYQEYSLADLQRRLGHEQFPVLTLPLERLEPYRTACALTDRWRLQRSTRHTLAQLERRVEERTAQLLQANAELQIEIADHRAARAALQRQQAELRTVFDLIPAAVWFMDTSGNILRVNRLAADMTGHKVEDIEGHAAREIYPNRPAEIEAENRQVLAEGKPLLGTLRATLDATGAPRYLQVDKVPFHDGDGNVLGVVTVAQDVTDAQQRKQQLRESEERLRAIVDSALDCIVSMDADGRITEFNPAAERTFLYRRDDVIGRPLHDVIIPPELREAHRQGVARVLATGETRLIGKRVEMPALRADGGRIQVELAITRVGDEARPSFTCMLRDITEQRRAQELRSHMEKQLADSLARQQLLSRRLVDIREREHQHLSAELHDRIGQNLTALSINLGIIGETAARGSAPQLDARLEDSRHLLETTIASVRDLVTQLRPASLDDYGLLAGLRGYAAGIEARTGLHIVVEGEEPSPRLPPAVEEALFRIAQEALTNTVKHAHARQVRMSLLCSADQATLTIADDGVGFDAERLLQGPPRISWGLEVMRERAEAVAARLTISAACPGGTCVTVHARRRP